MKAWVPAIALAGIVVSQLALAQTNATSSQGSRPAPVGHRQPRAADVERAQTQKGASASTAPQKSSDIDQRLIICRGC
jgi:hypothetical protein